MKVGVYSNNIKVNTTLISMAAQSGCKFVKIINYNKAMLKGNDIVIVDLDNIEDGIDKISNDATLMKEIVFVGISRNDDVLDKFRASMNVEKKPFVSKDFNYYKMEVSKRTKTDQVVNKEEERIYNEFGINLAKTFSDSNIGISERVNILRKKISITDTTIEPEKKFLENIGLSHVKVIEPEKIDNYSFDIKSVVEDDAILRFRIFKLKKLNISDKDIDEFIAKIGIHNYQVINKPKVKENNKKEIDILEQLRNSGKNATKEPVTTNSPTSVPTSVPTPVPTQIPTQVVTPVVTPVVAPVDAPVDRVEIKKETDDILSRYSRKKTENDGYVGTVLEKKPYTETKPAEIEKKPEKTLIVEHKKVDDVKKDEYNINRSEDHLKSLQKSEETSPKVSDEEKANEFGEKSLVERLKDKIKFDTRETNLEEKLQKKTETKVKPPR